MKRKIMTDLVEWKNNKEHKPLIIRGARRVGKTYILKEFGEKYYKNIAYFNFESNKSLYNIFENNKDLDKIIEQLNLVNGAEIEKENTLIIFDEIQGCLDALFALQYFNKESGYHVVGACSFYPLRISKIDFYIGKILSSVDFINLYPMTFSEFLEADGCENLVEFMKSIHKIEAIPKIFEDKLIEKLKIYFLVGGMPEAVYSWVNEKNFKKVNDIQQSILDSYSEDFFKGTDASEAKKISLIWEETPMRLAKEKKNYVYQNTDYVSIIKEESAIDWLSDAHLIYHLSNIINADFPFIKYSSLLNLFDFEDFKIYLNDIGLLCKMFNLDSNINNNMLFEGFNGAFVENYVCQTFSFNPGLNYFTFDHNEIDFVIEYKNGEIIPIEVKSNKGINKDSLIKYSDKYNFHKCLRFSLDNLKKDGDIINVPLYLIEYIENIL